MILVVAMKKLYRVTFSHWGQIYETIVEADCKEDAIAYAQEIGFGEDWDAFLLS